MSLTWGSGFPYNWTAISLTWERDVTQSNSHLTNLREGCKTTEQPWYSLSRGRYATQLNDRDTHLREGCHTTEQPWNSLSRGTHNQTGYLLEGGMPHNRTAMILTWGRDATQLKSHDTHLREGCYTTDTHLREGCHKLNSQDIHLREGCNKLNSHDTHTTEQPGYSLEGGMP